MEEIFNVIIAIGAFILAGFFSGKAYTKFRAKCNTDSSGSSRNSNTTDRAADYDKRITELEQRTNRAVSKLQQKISDAQEMDNTNDSE